MDEVMAKGVGKHADVREMTFERALKELEGIVGRLERGDVELEESITIYERGEVLRDHCDRLFAEVSPALNLGKTGHRSLIQRRAVATISGTLATRRTILWSSERANDNSPMWCARSTLL